MLILYASKEENKGYGAKKEERGERGVEKVREKVVKCLMCFLVYLRSKP